MTEARPPLEPDWRAGFEDVRAQQQADAALALTPLERLRWLDEAKDFVARYAGRAAPLPPPLTPDP